MNKIQCVRLIDGRKAMIETSRVASPYIQASIQQGEVYGGWGPMTKSKIAKDNKGYVKA